ncbi:MAG: hypothetical protein EBU81_00610 [Proteobacteria bacterium]|nr:hypothetical protein [Pseudomonadota bacterium]
MSLAGCAALVAGSSPESSRLPVILRQPISQGAYAGDTVTLSVVALPPSSAPSTPLSYQWLAGTNQTPIANGAYNSTNAALSQLVLTNVATGYSGPFRVAVTAGTNTVVSEPAQLSVAVGIASNLRLGTVSLSTNAGAQPSRRYSFPVIFSVMGPDRGVGVTWTYDPGVVRDMDFIVATDAPTNTVVRTVSAPGRFSFLYTLPADASVAFSANQQIGQLVLTTGLDRDPAQALAAAQWVPVLDTPSTNTASARPPLSLPSGSDRALGTNLAELVTFPLNVLMTPQVRSEALADVLLIVTGLTNDSRGGLVSLASSVGPVGTPPNPSLFVGPMDAFSVRRLTFEYYVSDGRADSIGTPGYVTEFALDSTIQTPVGRRSLVPVTYSPVLSGGVLLEFPTLTNFSYYIRYSDSLSDFSAQDNTNAVIRTARPAILGNGRKVQWLDNGLPRTESTPTNRFYRVLEFR